jgi:hypothetical protein
MLGDDWVAMGDGTYRFIGKQPSAPPPRWADAPIAASDERSADHRADPIPEPLAEKAKRRWRRP